MKEKTVLFEPKRIRRKKQMEWLARIGLFLFSFLLITVILVVEKESGMGGPEFMVGEPAPRTLFAPFNLSYINEEETALVRQTAKGIVLPVYRVDPSAAAAFNQDANTIFTALVERKKQTPALVPLEAGAAMPLPAATPPLEPVTLPATLPESSAAALRETNELETVRKHFEELMVKHLGQPIWTLEARQTAWQQGRKTVQVIAADNSEKAMDVTMILTVEGIRDEASNITKGLMTTNRRERSAALDLFNNLLRPNLHADATETAARQEKAAAAVAPVKEILKKNELIIQRGMRVTQEVKDRLDQIQKMLAKKEVLSKFLAVGLIVFLIYFFGFMHLYLFERKIFYSFRSLLLMHGCFLLTTLICKGMGLWSEASTFLFPLPLVAIVLALLLNARIAILSGAIMVLLAAPLYDFSPEVMMAAFLASAAGVYACHRLRKRIHFLRVGLAVGAVYALVIFAFQILSEYTIQESFMIALQGFANGMLVTTPIAFLLLPIFEMGFDLVTDVTLLEYSDLNHPLLKRMIIEAPGTYHHSLVVSTLAESACEAIGANALLARVGCYFHDIGKIARAEYFTENENRKSGSRHEKLTPTMSCLIIMSHVKDGIELGRRHKLRKPILDFIPEHQGTGVIYYFYKKALDHSDQNEEILADDFRYPGPKPQTRETAVALLSDSIEAASRSLREPTPEAIRHLVRKIINDKFIDGQLDECNLSLRDLHKIQESFVHNLMAIFHTRVKYPEKPESSEKVDLFRDDPFPHLHDHP